jgi:hypothetical protein
VTSLVPLKAEGHRWIELPPRSHARLASNAFAMLDRCVRNAFASPKQMLLAVRRKTQKKGDAFMFVMDLLMHWLCISSK